MQTLGQRPQSSAELTVDTKMVKRNFIRLIWQQFSLLIHKAKTNEMLLASLHEESFYILLLKKKLFIIKFYIF
jgi:hypothetical protein